MKRLIIGLIVAIGMLIVTNARADVKQDPVDIKLIVYQIIKLDVLQTEVVVIPGPEDYAAPNFYAGSINPGAIPGVSGSATNISEKNAVITCSTAPGTTTGFADRADALSLEIFTNARSGANVYVSAVADPTQKETLRVEDIYLTVMQEKTYVLMNGLEGAFAQALTSIGSQGRASWMQLDNEAKLLFGVKQSTKNTRLWVLKLGIGNLARYTENEEDGYKATLTFTLMPKV